MSNRSELAFLVALSRDPTEALQNVWWLLSDFDAAVWIVSIGYKKPKTFDWRIPLEDGSLLTDEKNRELLKGLRFFLAASTQGNSSKSGQGRSAAKTQQTQFTSSLRVIDKLLLNSSDLKLGQYGLEGINENHLKHILETYASTNSASDSIYEFTNRATRYCLEIVGKTPSEIISATLSRHPSMAIVSASVMEVSTYEFATEQIPRIRAALFFHDFYLGNNAGGYHINTRKLIDAILPDTLNKNLGRARIHILSFFPAEPAYRREMDAAPVRSETPERVTTGSYVTFRSHLYALGRLRGLGIAAPPQSALNAIMNYSVQTRENQRYRLVPFDVIMNQFTKAIEFHFMYGRIILDSYCRVARHCIKNDVRLEYLSDQEIIAVIDPRLKELGILKLGLMARNDRHYGPMIAQKKDKEEFYANLRLNRGLLEMVAIYIGAVQFVVGLLMARRLSELMELPLQGCLDKTLEWMVFDVAKTSKELWGVRDKQARPIDKLGSRMIRELQRFQRYLKKIGYIKKYGKLFATPSLRGKMALSSGSIYTYLRNLDFMFDYFEAPKNSVGQRYYIRQHQLRRFFALLFFHFFDGQRINSIRWHLGHADIQHLWHYITETIDGVSLRGAKSQYVIERMLKDKDKAYLDLAGYIEETYGITDVHVADEDEVDSYIQEQMSLGNVTIEPLFLNDEQGDRMNIIVIIKRDRG